MSDENLLVCKQTVIFFLRGPISVLKMQAGPFEEGKGWVLLRARLTCGLSHTTAGPSAGHIEGCAPAREPRPHLLDLDVPSAAAPTPPGTAAVPTLQTPRGFPRGPALGDSAVALGPKGWSCPRGFAPGSARALLGRQGRRFVPSHFCSQNLKVGVFPLPGQDQA